MKGKAGWGFTGVDTKIDLTQINDKKAVAIWEQAEVNVISVPEIQATSEGQTNLSAPPAMTTGKVQDYTKLVLDTRKTTLAAAEEGVELDDLLAVMRGVDQVQQLDEQWQFARLKNEIYQHVSKLYGKN